MARNLSYVSSFVNKFEIEQFFSDFSGLMKSPQPKPTQSELERFASTIARKIELATAQEFKINKIQATRFNVFDLIEPDENKLSDILAGLLDPHGDHGQGDLFLKLFLEQLDLAFDSKITKNATVQREALTHGIPRYRRRVDILVNAGVLIAIENKVEAPEQQDQVGDYLEHLYYCTRGCPRQLKFIYLTRNHRLPKSLSPLFLRMQQKNKGLETWSYDAELRKWLETCREKCEAQKICNFLADFISYIESSMKCRPISNGEVEINAETNER
jgi:hypothetical protein